MALCALPSAIAKACGKATSAVAEGMHASQLAMLTSSSMLERHPGVRRGAVLAPRSVERARSRLRADVAAHHKRVGAAVAHVVHRLGRLAGIGRRERRAQPLVERRGGFVAVPPAPGEHPCFVFGAGRDHETRRDLGVLDGPVGSRARGRHRHRGGLLFVVLILGPRPERGSARTLLIEGLRAWIADHRRRAASVERSGALCARAHSGRSELDRDGLVRRDRVDHRLSRHCDGERRVGLGMAQPGARPGRHCPNRPARVVAAAGGVWRCAGSSAKRTGSGGQSSVHRCGQRRIGEPDGVELGEGLGVGDHERGEHEEPFGGAHRDGGLGAARAGEPGAHARAVGDEAVAHLGEELRHFGLRHVEHTAARDEDAGPGARGGALERLDVHDGVRPRPGRGQRLGGLGDEEAEPEQDAVLGGGDAGDAVETYPGAGGERIECVAVKCAVDVWGERAGLRGWHALGGERRGEVEGRRFSSMVRAAAFLSPALAAAAVAGAGISGVPTVTDGDTLRIGSEPIRLHGIDAPESKRSCRAGGDTWACGAAAARALRERIAGRPVECVECDRDRYGRNVRCLRAHPPRQRIVIASRFF